MVENFIKLYDIAKPFSKDRTPLYFQGDFAENDGKIRVEKDKTLDLGTYFNAFSLKKWTDYTNITNLKIELNLKGNFALDVYGMDVTGEEKILSLEAKDTFSYTIVLEKLKEFAEKFDMLSVKLTAKEDGEFLGGAYFGEFSELNDIHIGITICTFKREKYLLPNLEKLKTLTAKNPDFSVMVIDNGNTLEEKNTEALKILHNPNYGGSGGFTRGIMEQINGGKATHILLSDDDTVLELSAFDRLYSFLRGLKAEHNEKFFAGAMLSIEKPTIQAENTAIFNKIISKLFGADFDLTDKKTLCVNEYPTRGETAYAGWWFTCVPVKSVKQIGYPLPLFIKGDDMEYSIRRGQDLLTLSGVGVWHETFGKKFNPAMRFFNDRNMLLLNHLLPNGNKNTFLASLLGRIAKHLSKDGKEEVVMLNYAIKELFGGFEEITAIPADKKFQEVRNYPLDKNTFASICSTLCLGIKYYLNYDAQDKKIKDFVKEKLQDQSFWRKYLNLKCI